MVKLALITLLLAQAGAVFCQQAPQDGGLMPRGIRAIPTPDDSAIIIVSDPTNGTGQGLQWLEIGGAIACDADNSIIVWSGDGQGRIPPQPPPTMPAPPPPSGFRATPPRFTLPSPPAQPGQSFLWPEGTDGARPLDLDNGMVTRDIRIFEAHVQSRRRQ